MWKVIWTFGPSLNLNDLKNLKTGLCTYTVPLARVGSEEGRVRTESLGSHQDQFFFPPTGDFPKRKPRLPVGDYHR